MKRTVHFRDLSYEEQGSRRWQTLAWLVHYPLLSARHIARLREIPLRTAQWHLGRLVAEGWLAIIWYPHPRLQRKPTPLYMLTRKALEFLCPEEFTDWKAYAHSRRYTAARLERLLLAMDRVLPVRDWLLSPHWKASDWSVEDWDEEVGFDYRESGWQYSWDRDPWHSVSLHAAALLHGRKGTTRAGQWAWVAVEMDTGNLAPACQVDRLRRFIRAQGDDRFGRELEARFPPLVIITRTHERQIEYERAVLEASKDQRVPITYLTYLEESEEWDQDADVSDWYSLLGRKWGRFLEDFQANTDKPHVYWRRLPEKREKPVTRILLNVVKETNGGATSLPEGKGVSGMAQLTISLQPLEKLILRELGHHPLLGEHELAFLLHTSSKYVRCVLPHLRLMGLVSRHLAPPRKAKRRPKGHQVLSAYTLADRGIRYLCAIDGFGSQVQHYVQVRGWCVHVSRYRRRKRRAQQGTRDWGDVFASLVHLWEHTRAGNAFMILLARVAERRGDSLNWLSEHAARLELEYQIVTSDPHPPRMATRDWGGGRPRPRGERGEWMAYGQRKPFFLPDARGEYIAGDNHFPFALEVDRTHVRFSNIWDKYRRYGLSLDDGKGYRG